METDGYFPINMIAGENDNIRIQGYMKTMLPACACAFGRSACFSGFRYEFLKQERLVVYGRSIADIPKSNGRNGCKL